MPAQISPISSAMQSILQPQHVSHHEAVSMYFPWHAFSLLALESNSVINLRLAKIGRGGSQAYDEVRLMFAEKASAAMEAGTAMMTGGTLAGLVDGYRVHVAANQARLEVAG